MKLIPTLPQFISEVEELALEGERLFTPYPVVKLQQDLTEFKGRIKAWSEKVSVYLQNAFDPAANELSNSFRYSGSNSFSISGARSTIEMILKDEISNIKERIGNLRYQKRFIAISDAIIDPQKVEREGRGKWSTEQIAELLMTKLYSLYDNNYHPIKEILVHNGIVLARYGEEKEIGSLLERNGFVVLMKGRDTTARLTLDGKMAVESIRNPHKENYEEITSNKAEVDSRIDEIIAELSKQGLGQEILFDELQEIKEMYTKLNKKNWGQLIKGKLLDLAIGKIVENDTIKYIYEKITHHDLLLP